MTVYETTHPQATENELKFLDRIFSTARFMALPDSWFDHGTEAKLLEIMYLVGHSQPSGLFRGTKDGKPDEEDCCFSEFYVTWPDESIE